MKKPCFRQWIVRCLALAAAVFFAIGGPLPYWAARVVPGASSLVALADSIAARSWYGGIFWTLPPVGLIGLGLWRGRFFCRWLCPAGTLYTAAGNFGWNRRILKRRWGGVVFWAILAGAVLGVPVGLSLDPLSTWGRISIFWNGALTPAALVPGLVLPILLVLSTVQPAVWCTHFCPLGWFFEFLRRFRREPVQAVNRTRRDILAGLGFGLPAAYLFRRIPIGRHRAGGGIPLLPPGAGDPRRFADLCTRCYACIDACPTHVIRVRFLPGRTPGQLFQPELDPNVGFCEQFCNRCTQVCPTGAIRPLIETVKQDIQIGIAQFSVLHV